MTGESPDDIEARREANERVLRDAIAAGFQRPIPTIVPRDPTPEPPRDLRRMSDNYLGRHNELRSDVENLKSNFSDLRHDIEGRFLALSTEVRESTKGMEQRLDKLLESQSNNRPDVKGAATVVIGVVSVVLTIAWYYSTLTQGAITDKVQFTNDKIAALTSVTKDNFASTTDAIKTVVASVQKLQDTTIPRPELEFRINTNRDAIGTLNKTVAENVVPRTEFEKRLETVMNDIETLKENTIKRADLDGRFLDFIKRIDLISNRVEILQQTSAGTAVLQEQLREAQAQIKELRDRAFSTAR